MTLKLFPDAAGDFRNAQFLAHAADLAYLNQTDGPPAFQQTLGLQATLISVDNTQVYVAKNDEAIVVAFRGSETPNSIDGLKDWLLTNAVNYLVAPKGDSGADFTSAGVGALFHSGFLNALHEVWPPLLDAVNSAVEEKERPVWITGHSLGGALALLAAWRFNRNFIEVHQVYTFGAPMIGNEAAAKAFEQAFPNKIFRYVDDRDFVPKLPTISLVSNTYQHCVTEVPLGASATIKSAFQALQGLGVTVVEGVLNADICDRIWGKCTEMLDMHLMPNYQSLIGEKCNK
jgi:hypothetical protein